MSFCRLRTFFRSPACDAVKIRCRSRRTSASTRRQSMACQSRAASSGPFTTPTAAVAASNLSFGSGLRSSSSPRAHLTASARVRARAPRPGIRPVIRHDRLEGPTIRRGFPSPFGRRHSLLGHPVPAEELGPPCGRLTGHPIAPGPRRGYRVPHARAATGVGAPSTPRTAVLPLPSRLLDRRLPLRNGQSLHPAALPIDRALASRGINEGSRNSPVRSSPRLWPPGWSRPPLGFPRASHPAGHERTSRWGQAIEHGPGTTRSTSHQSILQSVVHSQRATSRRTTSTRRQPCATWALRCSCIRNQCARMPSGPIPADLRRAV
jgi:hypothetical protein